jgi:hypothetical protein
MVKKFSDLGIIETNEAFVGKKIDVEEIFNMLIKVIAYKIEDSKYKEKGNGKRLFMQIEIDNVKRVVFTGSVNLQQIIQQVKKEDFPFEAKIVKDDKRFKFI